MAAMQQPDSLSDDEFLLTSENEGDNIDQTKKRLKDEDDKIDNVQEDKSKTLSDIERILEMALARLPTPKAKILAKNCNMISNPLYFGDSVDEIENRLKNHSSNLFAVTATIAPNKKYRRRNDTIKYECYTFPYIASKDADCSRGVCTSCNTHFYLYHKYECIWQLQRKLNAWIKLFERMMISSNKKKSY
ncbi:hypothetical protein RFI_02267 [Reticulomyxa filosa]|uniref:Uncharacterized protein n=1 Tax=Reticulomyxa filosa TaxID=46433 RepID=X6P8E4_RETFI|nr:hypothetical protein RFI_02267 [Reticulomyxa filosa]|eukprot:ETO34820.1 hypothetical protein RFI_02267 [Reticulomyxa filosa]